MQMKHKTHEPSTESESAGKHIIQKTFVWVREHVDDQDHGQPAKRIRPQTQRAAIARADPDENISSILADHAYANFQRTIKPANLVDKYFTMSCDRCDQSLVDLKDAQQHYRQQHSRRGHLTCFCGHRFGIPADIIRHCAFHASASPHKCIDCCKVFGSVEALALHQADEHAEGYGPIAEAGWASAALTTAEYVDDDVLDSVAVVRAEPSEVAPVASMNAEYADSDVQHSVALVETIHSKVSTAAADRYNPEAMTAASLRMSKKALQAYAKRYKKRMIRYNRMLNAVPDDDDEMIGRYIPMACIKCDITFKSFDLYWYHLRTDHASTRRFVECCNRQFYSKPSVLKHCHWHDKPHELDCTICDWNHLANTSLQCLEDHISQKHFEHAEKLRQWQCFMCQQTLEHRRALRAHQIEAHPVSQAKHGSQRLVPYTCTLCGKTLFGITKYEYHCRQEHSAEKADLLKVQCTLCEATLSCQKALRSHMRSHTYSPRICEQCGYIARSVNALCQHRYKRHSPNRGRTPATQQEIACSDCDQVFTDEAEYLDHCTVLHNVDGREAMKRQCIECGKWLKSIRMLLVHAKRHGLLPVSCPYCDHTAVNKYALYSHRARMHSVRGKKIIPCSECDEKFERLENLRSHMASQHGGETPSYQCMYCPKKFRWESCMYAHRKKEHIDLLTMEGRRTFKPYTE